MFKTKRYVASLENDLRVATDLFNDTASLRDLERRYRLRAEKALAKSEESKREIILENHETVAHLENDNRRLRELVRLLVKDV